MLIGLQVRRGCKLLVACTCLFFSLTGCQTPKKSNDLRRPNVLFIAVDDLNDWIQLLDEKAPIKTPNLRRLAQKGTLFTNAYCSSPACNPSRASLLTGIMPSTSGVYGNKSDWRGALPDAVTIPQHFKAHGYRTMGAGKIFHHHLSGAFHDEDSFEDFQMIPDPPDSPMPSSKLNKLEWFGSVNTDWGIWPVGPGMDHVDIRTADYVIRQLEKKQEGPFFLAAGIFRPHMPFFAPEEFFNMYPLDSVVMPAFKENDLADLPEGARALMKPTDWFFDGIRKAENEREGTWKEAVRAYQASATFADAQIGRILDALDESPYKDNTIIVLWSDHGYHLGEKEHWEKFALYEKTTHVPLIIAAPGVTTAGTICDEPVSLLDIYPTLIDLCSLRQNYRLEGVSLLPQLEDPETVRSQPAIMTYQRNNHAVRSDRWRYIRYADGTEELYDLERDPNEWFNLATHSDMRATMDSLQHWMPRKNAPEYGDLKKPRKASKEARDEVKRL